ncbi:F0F1 ATP synthase subunit delta [Shigella flexneri]
MLQNRLKALTTVCGEQIDEHVQNLVRIMAGNGRLSDLLEVSRQFATLRAALESNCLG